MMRRRLQNDGALRARIVCDECHSRKVGRITGFTILETLLMV